MLSITTPSQLIILPSIVFGKEKNDRIRVLYLLWDIPWFNPKVTSMSFHVKLKYLSAKPN